MIVGFKCQTSYPYFLPDDEAEVWVDLEFTQEFYDKYICLIEADAYESQFRVLV